MSELIERLRDEWLRKATSSFTCQECGIQANFIDEIENALDAKDKQIAELEAVLERAEDLIGPFAKEADQWSASVPDAYRPGVTEPGYSQAHGNAEFSIGDLRAARAFMAKIKPGLPLRSSSPVGQTAKEGGE